MYSVTAVMYVSGGVGSGVQTGPAVFAVVPVVGSAAMTEDTVTGALVSAVVPVSVLVRTVADAAGVVQRWEVKGPDRRYFFRVADVAVLLDVRIGQRSFEADAAAVGSGEGRHRGSVSAVTAAMSVAEHQRREEDERQSKL